VFVTPLGAEPKPAWSVRQTAGASELVLRNEGTAHLQVRRIVLQPTGRDAPAGTIDSPAYVLAGQEHAWLLPSVAGSTALQLEAETSIGPLSATVALPRG
jgi:P pilus assembly chaperone PapD